MANDIPAYGPYAHGSDKAAMIAAVEATSAQLAAQRAALMDNERLRQQREAALKEAEKAAAERRRAEEDQLLEPRRLAQLGEFLLRNPDRSVEDFNRKVWPTLRESELQKAQVDRIQQTKRELRASGRYEF